MNLSLDLEANQARIRASGYLSRQASKNLAVLLKDLGRMGVETLHLDLSECSPVCVGALETLLDVKFFLAGLGVSLRFAQPPPSVSRVFEIMGLQSNGELPVSAPHH